MSHSYGFRTAAGPGIVGLSCAVLPQGVPQ